MNCHSGQMWDINLLFRSHTMLDYSELLFLFAAQKNLLFVETIVQHCTIQRRQPDQYLYNKNYSKILDERTQCKFTSVHGQINRWFLLPLQKISGHFIVPFNDAKLVPDKEEIRVHTIHTGSACGNVMFIFEYIGIPVATLLVNDSKNQPHNIYNLSYICSQAKREDSVHRAVQRKWRHLSRCLFKSGPKK